MITGVEEIAQIMKQNLQTVLGEVFLDTSLGVPWFDEIFEKGQTQKNIDSILIDEISRTPGFISLVRFETTYNAAEREIAIDFEAYTVEGILDFSDTISAGGA
jgi:hypothetical protein